MAASLKNNLLFHVKVKICHLSPVSQRARELNVRRERANYRRMAERLKASTSLSVNEDQNSELVKLIECISTSKEGQEGLNKVFKEADVCNPGRGTVLKELWELERQAFFKDQRKNGEALSFLSNDKTCFN